MNNEKFILRSDAFENGKVIPSRFATKQITGGLNISLPLQWENIPKGTNSFAIIIVDLHPIAKNWVHWLVINLPANVSRIPEGVSGTNKIPVGSKELNNTFGWIGYGGPQPPKGSGLHKYEITVYALNIEKLNLDKHTSLVTFNKSIEGKVIQSAKVVGIFER